MAKKLVIRGGQKILGSIASGSGDEILTIDSTTKDVGKVPAIDPSVYLSSTLTSGKIYLGNASNIATAVTPTGAILFTNTGLTSIATDVIVDANINTGAGIQYSKLNLTNSIVNNDISSFANITRTKLAAGNINRVLINDASGVFSEHVAITPNRVLISNSVGLPIDSGLTTTVLSYVDPTSSIQTQLNNRLLFDSTITPSDGDLVYFNSGVWNRFPRGTSGQFLSSTGSSLAWVTTPNGLPTGGTTNQYLKKQSGTDFDTIWDSLTIGDLPDITATAAQINVLATGFYDATSSIQTQIGNKLNNSLSNNAIFVGNFANQVSQLAVGGNGQVLTVVAGVPQWATISGTGTVTQVDGSGGTTGLTLTGGPITSTGTLTIGGTLGTVNGGTNLTSYATGDIIYASGSNVLSKLAAGTNGYVLTLSGGVPTWQLNAGSSPLTTKGDLYTYDTGVQRLGVGTNGFVLTADSTTATGLKWSSASAANPFADNIALIKNNADNTKLAVFDASNITTGTTRTYTLPNVNGTIALLGSTNGATLSKTDDTNVTLTLGGTPNTALLAATSLTLGWSGTLAYSRFVNGAGLSVVGRSANTSGVQGDIVASLDGQTLRRSGTSIGFGSLDLANTNAITGLLPYANLSNGVGLSIIGRSANSSGVQADITAATDGNVLRRSGTTLGFGSLDLTAAGTVGSSILGIANGGTGAANLNGLWQAASGATLTGPNTITGTTTNTLKGVWNGLAVTQVDGAGLWLQNSTAAALNAQQISPSLVFEGNGWNTTGGTTSALKWSIDNLPVQAGTAYGTLRMRYNGTDVINSEGSLATSAVYSLKVSTASGLSFGVLGDASLAIGQGSARIYPSGSTGAPDRTGNLVAFATNPNSNSGVFTIIASSAVTATSGQVSGLSFLPNRYSLSMSSGTATAKMISIEPTINTTGTYSGTSYGVDYNPTLTSTTGLTNIAWRNTSGTILIGGTTPTANTRVDNRGLGTTTNLIERWADSGNTERLAIQDNGVILLAGSAGSSGQILTSQGSGSAPIWTTVSGTGDMVLASAQTSTAKKTFSVTGTISGINIGANASDPTTTLAAGDLYYQTGVGVRVYSGSAWSTIGAGGGISNSASNTELMVSNGTNAIGGKIFSPSNGNITLGDSGLSGTTRTFLVESSVTNTGFNFITKGSGGITFGSTDYTNKGIIDLVQKDFATTRYSNVEGGIFTLYRTRGTQASPTALSTSDVVGTINFSGYDGSGNFAAASIRGVVNGTVSSGVVPIDLVLYSGTNASPSEKLRLSSNGAWGINGTNYGSTGQVLTSQGSGASPIWSSAGGSGITRSIINQSTNITAGATASVDYVYNCTSTFTLTLPTAVGNTNKYTIKNSGTGTITINTTSSQTIDGGLTATISVQYNSFDVVSDGSNWIII